MCGICGFLQKMPLDPNEASRIVNGMCAAIAHRGPDEQGIFIDREAGAALGHQRLSIIDLASGKQPMANEDGTVNIVFNGEIYNFREIREILIGKGHVFQTGSDTETIIHAYEEWGTDCLKRLRGMFAFAIWDSRQHRLFCARDRVGIKPFYYYFDGKIFVFASEIKAILRHPVVTPQLADTALVNYLRLFYVPAPQTIYRNIFKLRPGHQLLLENGNMSVEPYWSLNEIIRHPGPMDLTDAANELRHLLEEAVDIRLISEVPLGAFLSGGVDSSLVVALMSRIMGGGVLSHTVGFADRDFDESIHARKIADSFQCNHSEITLQPDIQGILPKLVWHMDEPFGDSSMVPTYYICQAARKRVTVCLSGDGGDELFAGYNWYAELQRLSRMDRQVPELLRTGCGRLGALLSETLRGTTLLRNLAADWPTRHVNLLCGFTDRMIQRLVGKENITDPLQHEHPLALLYREKSAGFDPVLDGQYVDFSSYMVDDILMKVDKMSMAHSLEVRVPLLDHKVAELAFSLATNLKIQGEQRKIILKECIGDLIPPDFFNRKKQGFAIPQKSWLQHELHGYVEEYLLSSSSRVGDYLDRREIQRLWERMCRSRYHIDLSPHIWALLSFELWARTFLTSTRGREPIT